MRWNKLIGQTGIADRLQRAIINGRIPHSYLFIGPEGVGKDALAIEFAKTLNCSSPVEDETGIVYCDICQNCKKIDALQHPNLVPVFSLPTGASKTSDTSSFYSDLSPDQITIVKDQLAAKALNPYRKFKIPNANNVKIATIRILKKNLVLSQNQKGRRIVIIFEADEMNAEAANAFLKTLEEPHENITMILTTSKPEQILPTIKSRCQELKFPPIPDDIIARKAIEDYHLSPETAGTVAALSQGSFSKALDFIEMDATETRNDAIEAFRTSLKKTGYRIALLESIDSYIKDKDKKKAKAFLSLFELWMRDAALIDAGGAVERMCNIDQAATIEKFVSNFRGKDFAGAVDLIDDAFRQIDKNVQLNTIFLSLYIKLRRIFLTKR
jgi:DNA polymerase-3 subunit delta'